MDMSDVKYEEDTSDYFDYFYNVERKISSNINTRNKMKIFEMFAGFGGASFALKKIGIPFECVGYSEIDKYAIQCYGQNHKGYNYGDCIKINPNELQDFDLLTGGFPCQSFSVAGRGLGELDTRGTLFNEIIRIAEVKQPRYMLLENVKGLTNKNHKETFNKILSELKRIGYYIHWRILNSKEYGIPQNRQRVFFVCFKNEDEFNNFKFPEKQELKIFLKDILEDEVDEKYYLSEKQLNKVLSSNFSSRRALYQGDKKVSSCLEARDYKEPKIIKLNNNKNIHCEKSDGTSFTLTGSGRNSGSNQIVQLNNPTHSNNRVYSQEGISPTLMSQMGLGGGNEPFISIDRAIMIGNLSRYTMKYPRNPYSKDKNTSWCIDPAGSNGISTDGLTVRKLTPKECFRLMGFLDDEINLKGLSNTQRYKLAGNGWEINLVSKIFKQMFSRGETK